MCSGLGFKFITLTNCQPGATTVDHRDEQLDARWLGNTVRKAGPNRSFGFILAAVCGLLTILAYRAGLGTKFFWGGLALLFLLIALAVPRVLSPIRRGWLKVGYWLGLIVNPLILGAIFATVFVPVGSLMQLFGRDPMARRYDPAASSYWINRAAKRPTDSLREQF